MSLRADGWYRCDRCGAGVGNASVEAAAVISDIEPDDPLRARVLHLCRQPDGGCARLVLNDSSLADLIRMESP